ncbi:MAG: sugar kinase [PVC group bacterium]|nr:sugar kinase [PVC group bacterium]
MSIVVLGTVAYDSIKTPWGTRKDLLGGSAAHFSMSASAFTKVHLAAVIGKDFPNKDLNFFKKKGINAQALLKKEGKTFRWQGEYKADDLNSACTLHTELGVIITHMPELTEAQKNIKTVFLGNYDPDLQYKFLKTMRKPELVAMDSMNLWIHTKLKSVKRLLKCTDILFVNDQEARDLSGESNLVKAAKCLKSYGPKIIVLKKGEHGVLLYSSKSIFTHPAYPIEKVVDPTGAGDTFAGGVMGYLAKAKRINEGVLKKALAYGTIFSSYNVEGFGLKRTGALTKKDVQKRMKEYKGFFQF